MLVVWGLAASVWPTCLHVSVELRGHVDDCCPIFVAPAPACREVQHATSAMVLPVRWFQFWFVSLVGGTLGRSCFNRVACQVVCVVRCEPVLHVPVVSWVGLSLLSSCSLSRLKPSVAIVLSFNGPAYCDVLQQDCEPVFNI